MGLLLVTAADSRTTRKVTSSTQHRCSYDVYFGQGDSVLEAFFFFPFFRPVCGPISIAIRASYNRPMSDPGSESSENPNPRREPVLFAAEDTSSAHSAAGKTERNWMPWIVASVVICGALGLAYWFGRPPASSTGTGVDPYAKYLVLGNVQVSQASNFAGDQLTYVDGTIENRGPRTVTAVTLQTVFANDSGEAPQVLQAPVSLIRSRDPYVDTEPISAAPLVPGKSQDFRLVFDNVSPMWNQRPPQLHVLHVETRP